MKNSIRFTPSPVTLNPKNRSVESGTLTGGSNSNVNIVCSTLPKSSVFETPSITLSDSALNPVTFVSITAVIFPNDSPLESPNSADIDDIVWLFQNPFSDLVPT